MVGPGGVTIDMAAAGALAAALGELLDDPARRAQLGAAARKHCEDHFSRIRVVDQIHDYYRFVFAHPSPRSRSVRLPEPYMSLTR
jgi:glycosyltransferase involved in cell wall biosynthesis